MQAIKCPLSKDNTTYRCKIWILSTWVISNLCYKIFSWKQCIGLDNFKFWAKSSSVFCSLGVRKDFLLNERNSNEICFVLCFNCFICHLWQVNVSVICSVKYGKCVLYTHFMSHQSFFFTTNPHSGNLAWEMGANNYKRTQ